MSTSEEFTFELKPDFESEFHHSLRWTNNMKFNRKSENGQFNESQQKVEQSRIA